MGNIPAMTIKWPMDRVGELVPYLRDFRQEHEDLILKFREAGREARCWYSWPPSAIEWQWTELNLSKFNRTCGEYHRKNAYIATTKLLAAKASTARYRFYWPGRT